ncbi:MAG: hypothetical protein KDH09_11205 [Chrysiogenetes bacterium]|nr:hypothetical protein [Chrysiogenetes bacterium]
MKESHKESQPGESPKGIQLEDLSNEEFNRLFGKVFGKIKQAAGLDPQAPDEELYEQLRGSQQAQKSQQQLSGELEKLRASNARSREAAGRIFKALVSRLPEPVRESAPDPESEDLSAIGQWSELAARMSDAKGMALPKSLDSSRSGGAPQASDAETWLRLMNDSSAARQFKRAHPDEWRRLVQRFGGHPVSRVRQLISR